METAMMVLGDAVVDPPDNDQRLITINDEHSESMVQIKHYPCDADDQTAAGDAQSHRTKFYHQQNENATVSNCN